MALTRLVVGKMLEVSREAVCSEESITKPVKEPAIASKTRSLSLDTVYLFQQDGKRLLDVDFLASVIEESMPSNASTGKEPR